MKKRLVPIALAISRRMFGSMHEDIAAILHNLGQLYQRLGEFESAENSYLEAIEMREKTLGKEHPRFLGTVMGLAGLYYMDKKYIDAEKLFKAALPVIKATLGETHPTYALGLNNLASIYNDTKRYKEAENLLLNVLAIAGKNGNDPNLSDYINNLALTYRYLGNDEKTADLFKKGLNASLNSLRRNFGFLSEKEKENFAAGTLLEFNSYQSFHLDYNKKNPSASGTAYDIELATKGMILNTGVAMRQAILNSGDTEAIRLYDKWASLKATIAREYSLPPAKRKSELPSIENQANEYEKELNRLSSSFRNVVSLGNSNWKEVQASLKENEVALEFASFNYRGRDGWTDSTMYAALVLRKSDIFPQLIQLCEQKQLDSLLNKPQSTNEVFISALYRGLEGKANQSGRLSRRLFELIWKPIDHLFKTGDRIYFAPAGILNQIAFAAIPLDSTTLVSDKYKLEQVGSTAVLIKEKIDKQGNSVALFGGIQYTMTEQEMAAIVRNTKTTGPVSRTLTRNGQVAWNFFILICLVEKRSHNHLPKHRIL